MWRQTEPDLRHQQVKGASLTEAVDDDEASDIVKLVTTTSDASLSSSGERKPTQVLELHPQGASTTTRG